MTDRPVQPVQIGLSKSEALVLFEFVARFTRDGSLSIAHPAEEQILWDLCAELERQLVAPLMSNYAEVLDAARSDARPDQL